MPLLQQPPVILTNVHPTLIHTSIAPIYTCIKSCTCEQFCHASQSVISVLRAFGCEISPLHPPQINPASPCSAPLNVGLRASSAQYLVAWTGAGLYLYLPVSSELTPGCWTPQMQSSFGWLWPPRWYQTQRRGRAALPLWYRPGDHLRISDRSRARPETHCHCHPLPTSAVASPWLESGPSSFSEGLSVEAVQQWAELPAAGGGRNTGQSVSVVSQL